MPSTTNRTLRSRAEWQSLMERAVRSPLSITAFCQAESISPSSFYRWRRRLCDTLAPAAAAPSEPTFLDLGTLNGDPANTGHWDLELDLGGGILLRLRRG